MTGAELRVVREHLGLTTAWVAERLGVAERSVHRWESGQRVVPDGVRVAIEAIEAQTAHVVGAAVAALGDVGEDPALWTYRTDADYRAHHPEESWSASWHRAVCARVAQEVPGLVIDYWDDEHTDDTDGADDVEDGRAGAARTGAVGVRVAGVGVGRGVDGAGQG